MSRRPAPLPAPPLPVTPSLAAWSAMAPAARERWLLDALAALNEHEIATMAEGTPHSTAIANLRITLRDFFDRIGKKIFLASNLPIYYPDEPVFSPDLVAVADVDIDEEEDSRMGWVVADEGRGLDLALEVLHSGDRTKDLIDNVLRFARLGIPEYFVYDRKRLLIYGYRLPTPESTRYEHIPSRGGALRSRVLGLDLAISDGRLRFFYGEARVPESRELIERLHAHLERAERLAADEAAARADAQARAEAEAAARAALEARAAELERRLAELEKGSS